jgi:hypothetical protein
MMRVRAMLDVWLSVDADTEAEARTRVGRITHEAELNIEWLNALGDIIEIEEVSE